MILIPINIHGVLSCLLIAAAFEVLRILFAFILARPSGAANALEIKKLEIQRELTTVKSVQLELVKHSKLTRALIKCDKDLEAIQSQYAPKALRVKKYSRYVRVLAYIACGIYFWEVPLVLINPQVLWPVSWFTSEVTVSVPAMVLLFAFGGAVRHLLRTLLPLIFTKTTLP